MVAGAGFEPAAFRL